MPRAVLDSTILVSAFLKSKGISRQLLRQAEAGAFALCLATEILDETQRVLLEYPRIRKRYHYEDSAALEYVALLKLVAQVVTDLPQIRAVIRDPNDDMVIACAVKAKAGYIVSRDKDLLDLQGYQEIKILSPEQFITLLRK